ncbi:LysR family transcriptional regulator, hypochlorite-specific transcription factor HypT [Pararobbsia alpina]|uniref:LysR family transcriptional regulator n=1 Tax=Pararobbsia alpina TaxID=621374 RepID=UPI0039A5A62C
MEVKWIEDFLALTQYKTFSKAARARSLTQSGLSRRIQALEQWLGAELFDRSTFPPALTQAGHIFSGTAYDTLNNLFEARLQVRNHQRTVAPTLKIAASHALATSFVPAWLDGFQIDGQQCRTKITPVALNDGAMMLGDGHCDLMLVHEKHDEPSRIDPARYPSLSIETDELVPVCKPGASGQPLFDLNTLQTQLLPLASYASTTLFGRCVADMLSAARVVSRFRIAYESEWDHVLKHLVLEGRALAWLSRRSVRAELESGALVLAGGEEWVVKLAVKLYRDVLSKNDSVDRIWLSALPQA